jgi:protein-disulfide isomerase
MKRSPLRARLAVLLSLLAPLAAGAQPEKTAPPVPRSPEMDALAGWIDGFFAWGAGSVKFEEIKEAKIAGAKLLRAQRSYTTDQRLNDQVFVVVEDGGRQVIVGDAFVDAERLAKPAPIKSDADLAPLQEALKKYLRAPFRLVLDATTDRRVWKGVKLRIETGYGYADVPALVKANDGSLLMLGRVWDRHRPVPEQRKELIRLEGTPVQGPADARVTVVEFSDMECGFCKRRAASWEPLVEKLAPLLKIKKYLKNFPLTSDHPWAFRAASAGRCFFEVDPALFFRFKSQVYARQEQLSVGALDNFALDFAVASNVPEAAFKACYLGPKSTARILADIGEGYTVRVRATPTFYVDGVLVSWFSDNTMEEYLRTVYLKGAGLPLPTPIPPRTPAAGSHAQ